MSCVVRALFLFACLSFAHGALATCDPDGLQESGSIYRICMPDTFYNGRLVIWAHGFQDAGTPVSIPEDQLCFADICLPDLLTSLGFAFATNSYSKTGLAVRQGMDDIRDLVNIFTAQKGAPERVYLTGASEGGIITALLAEQYPDVFAAGTAACGPIGSFRYQIDYFGDARVTFEYFWPGLIPGNPLHPSPGLIDGWSDYREVFGRSASDNVLRQVGRTIATITKRASDVVAKTDNDNFLVLGVAMEADCAFGFAEQIVARIRALSIHHPRSPSGRFLSVSVGVVTVCPPRNASHETIVTAASRAVNLARSAGGNRAVSGEL